MRREGPHIVAFEHEPGKLPALNGSCTGDLLCAEVDTQNLSSWPDLFSEMQSRDTVPAGDVEEGKAWSERKVLEQGFSKGGGPIVLLGQWPAWSHECSMAWSVSTCTAVGRGQIARKTASRSLRTKFLCFKTADSAFTASTAAAFPGPSVRAAVARSST